MVISDYGRAKSLFAGTDIKIFKRGVFYKQADVPIVIANRIPLLWSLLGCGLNLSRSHRISK